MDFKKLRRAHPFRISHRGNTNTWGSRKHENNPATIDYAINLGLMVEVDIRCSINGNFYLGHDGPEHPVSENWLRNRSLNLILHAKNPLAHVRLTEKNEDRLAKYHVFSHDKDPYAVTSKGWFWYHPDVLNSKTLNTVIPVDSKVFNLIVLPNIEGIWEGKWVEKLDLFDGFCSDTITSEAAKAYFEYRKQKYQA